MTYRACPTRGARSPVVYDQLGNAPAAMHATRYVAAWEMLSDTDYFRTEHRLNTIEQAR
jgi:hypothetical protein